MKLSALAFVLLLVHEIQGQLDIQTFYDGKFRGSFTKYQNGGTVYKFLGIPYAKPPVGNLRFQKPKGLKSIPRGKGKVYMATDYKPACPQYSEQPYPWYDREPGQSEDCLYLNIWTPLAALNSKKEGFQVPVKGERIKRPVKVYIHGGGWFQTGSIRQLYYDGFGEATDTIDSDGNSLQDGVVVVTVQYRLGALGFLTSGTNDAPGNVGLFDIVRAVDWVASTITSFGGDGFQMTLVGQDSGAIALSFLSTTPSFGLPRFKIVVNGASFLTLKALPGVNDKGDAFDNNMRLTDVLAKEVGCEGSVREDPAAVVTCLRGVNATQLVQTMSTLSQKGPPDVFLPQIGGPHGFFMFDPFMDHSDWPFQLKLDALGSFTSDEGSHLLTSAFPKVFGDFGENDVPLSAACAKKAASSFLKKFPPSVADDLLRNLDHQPSVCNRKKVVRALGDAYFSCPVLFYAELIKKTTEGDDEPANRTFILEKNVIPPYNPWSEWMGSVHFDNVQTDFLHPYGYLLVNTEEGQQQYNYNDTQTAQTKAYNGLLRNFMLRQDLPISEFTLENPAYGVLASDATISSDGKTNYHQKNCDILRPYFQGYKD